MKQSTLVWAIIFVLGAIGLVANGLLRPNGFSKQFVLVTPVKFIEVDVAAPIGAAPDEKTVTRWVASDSPMLSLPNVSRTRTAPVGWSDVTEVSATEAWRRQGAPVVAGEPYVQFSWANTIGVWIAAFFTLAILSFLWNDNPVYKFAESVVVGVSAAYWMVFAFWSTLVPTLAQPLMPGLMKAWALPGTSGTHESMWWVAFFPLGLGLMLLMRLSPKGAWISVWPLAFIVGLTAGIKLVSHVQADFLAQISNSILPLVAMREGAFDWGKSLGNLTLIVGLLSVLTYFFFSIEHKGVVGKVARVGVWFLMVAFGAAFAFTVMGRITLLSARMQFLFDDWLWLIDPNGSHTVVATVKAATGVLMSALVT